MTLIAKSTRKVKRVVSQKRTHKISTAEALGLDPRDPSDRFYLRYENLLLDLRKIMRKRGISGDQLAKLMGVSRQEVYDRFSGKGTTLEWICWVSEALGLQFKVKIVKPAAH